jgi:hypothetical protein
MSEIRQHNLDQQIRFDKHNICNANVLNTNMTAKNEY